MSIASVKAFIERMKTDQAFAGKLAACVNAQARMALAKAAGFDLTIEEMEGLRTELTDQEVNGLAGAGGGYGGLTVDEHRLPA